MKYVYDISEALLLHMFIVVQFCKLSHHQKNNNTKYINELILFIYLIMFGDILSWLVRYMNAINYSQFFYKIVCVCPDIGNIPLKAYAKSVDIMGLIQNAEKSMCIQYTPKQNKCQQPRHRQL